MLGAAKSSWIRWLLLAAVAVALLLGALLGPPAVESLHERWNRPMFMNTFGYRHFLLFPTWLGKPWPYLDGRGDWIAVDLRLNILAVVADGPSPTTMGESVTHGYGTRLHTVNGWKVTIPRQRNALFLIFPDHEMREYPLASGQAERLYWHYFDSDRRDDNVLRVLSERFSSIVKRLTQKP